MLVVSVRVLLDMLRLEFGGGVVQSSRLGVRGGLDPMADLCFPRRGALCLQFGLTGKPERSLLPLLRALRPGALALLLSTVPHGWRMVWSLAHDRSLLVRAAL